MAGQPKKRALAEALELRTRDTFEGEENADSFTHLDYVEFWQASGNTITQLADELKVEPEFISRYLSRTFGHDHTRQRLRDARLRGAERIGDKALTVATTATSENHNVARLQVSTLQWTAEKWNPIDYGKNQAPQTVVNIGQLHLNALRNPLTGGSSVGAVGNAPARAFIEDGVQSVATAEVTDLDG